MPAPLGSDRGNVGAALAVRAFAKLQCTERPPVAPARPVALSVQSERFIG
jgi:hypothetical protein